MNTRGVREPTLRGYQRRKTVLNLDLNNMPPCENVDQEGTSVQAGHQEVQVVSRQWLPLPLPMIDVDAIEDEVVESSARAFAEAKSKARRNRETTGVVVVDSAHISNSRNKRRRDPPNQTIINCDLYINLESHSNSVTENAMNQQLEQSQPPPPPPEPIFTCPICMCPFTEEMSTKCGHIFCKECIKAAIATKNKCPTCRKKVTVKELIRIFLPATR